MTPSSYPGAPDNLPADKTEDTPQGPADHAPLTNLTSQAVNALQATLGTNPQDIFASVAARLASLSARTLSAEGGGADLVANPAALVDGAQARYSLARDRWEAVDAFTVYAAQEGVSASASAAANATALANTLARVPGAAHGRVVLPGGTVQLGSGFALTRGNLEIVGQGMDDTTLVQVNRTAALLAFAGHLAASDISLTSNVAVGDRTLQLVTTGLAAGMWLKLVSDESFAPESDSAGIVRGEYVQILTVDSGAQVTLTGAAQDAYAVASGARVNAVTLLPGVRLADFSVTAPDLTGKQSGLSLGYCLRPLVENVRTRDMYASIAIGAFNCVEPTFAHTRALNHPDDGSSGYGVSLGKGTVGALVLGPRGERVRHAFSTNGAEAAGTDNAGPARAFSVVEGQARDCSSVSWDTHSNSEDGRFVACGSRGAVVGAGYQIRGKAIGVYGCTSLDDFIGASVLGEAHLFHIAGLRVTNAGSRGLSLRHADDGVAESCVIDGSGGSAVYVDGVAAGVTRKLDRLTLRQITARNFGQDLTERGSRGDAGVYVKSDLPASTGWLIERCHFEYNPSPTSRQVKAAHGSTYGIDNECAVLTGSDFRNNTGRNVRTIRDLGGNRRTNNIRLDRPRLISAEQPSGVLASTMPRLGPHSNTAVLTSGKLAWTAIKVEAGARITDIGIQAGTTPVAGATLVQFGLMQILRQSDLVAARDVQAITADASGTAWAADTELKLALTSPAPYEVLDDLLLGVFVLVIATTVPTLRGFTSQVNIVNGEPRVVGQTTNVLAAAVAVADALATTAALGTGFQARVYGS